MGVQNFFVPIPKGCAKHDLHTANSDLLDLRPALATRAEARIHPMGWPPPVPPNKSKYKFGLSLKFETFNFETWNFEI